MYNLIGIINLEKICDNIILDIYYVPWIEDIA